MVYQYHDVTEHNYILILFAESGGQTPRDFGAADLEDSKQNFQLSDVVNILVSVTDNCKVICLLLYSALAFFCLSFLETLEQRVAALYSVQEGPL